jgi:hypothetical protein
LAFSKSRSFAISHTISCVHVVPVGEIDIVREILEPLSAYNLQRNIFHVLGHI